HDQAPGDLSERPAREALRALGRLVRNRRYQRIGDEAEHEVVEELDRAFELARVLDGPGRAGLDAEPAVHALADVDVEPLHAELGRRFPVALQDVDVDDLDRAGALASLARRADIHVDFEEPAVARRDG